MGMDPGRDIHPGASLHVCPIRVSRQPVPTGCPRRVSLAALFLLVPSNDSVDVAVERDASLCIARHGDPARSAHRSSRIARPTQECRRLQRLSDRSPGKTNEAFPQDELSRLSAVEFARQEAWWRYSQWRPSNVRAP